MKNKSREDFEKAFSKFEVGSADIIASGKKYFYVSVFDHWLNESEAESSHIINFQTACRADQLNDYLVGEEKFLKLYRHLIGDGMACNRPRPFKLFRGNTREVEKIFSDSLKEVKLMDVYFNSYDIRVIGGYDRTDLFIHEGVEKHDLLRNAVKDMGLFILN